MINVLSNQIVLIIGAGASNDLHNQFALGNELLRQISDRVTDRNSTTSNLSNLLEKLKFDVAIRNEFVKHLDNYINSSENSSIDGFIDEVSTYPEFESVRKKFTEIAKFSIIFHILGYESQLKNSISGSLSANAWIHEIAKFIDEKNILGTKPSDFSLKIITFNYDRTIEHFLYNHDRFENNKEGIRDYIEDSIIHVYGKIGNLPWQSSKDFFDFGEQNDREKKIFERRDAIDLMYMERLQKKDNHNKATGWIHADDNTKIIASLGFGFDLINSRVLILENLELFKRDIQVVVNIYPSADYDFKNRRIMANKIRSIKHDVELTYLSCTTFLKEILHRNITM